MAYEANILSEVLKMIKEVIKKMRNLFTDHPKSVNETYLQHMAFACPAGFKLIIAGLACCIHGLLPFVFKTTGSDRAKEVIEHMNDRAKNQQ